MSLGERIEQISHNVASWAIIAVLSGIVGGIWWAVRTLFTNQQQIKMLKDSLDQRDKLREEDRQALREVREDIQDVRQDVKHIVNVLMERK
jgi:hypothetical protein